MKIMYEQEPFSILHRPWLLIKRAELPWERQELDKDGNQIPKISALDLSMDAVLAFHRWAACDPCHVSMRMIFEYLGYTACQSGHAIYPTIRSWLQANGKFEFPRSDKLMPNALIKIKDDPLEVRYLDSQKDKDDIGKDYVRIDMSQIMALMRMCKQQEGKKLPEHLYLFLYLRSRMQTHYDGENKKKKLGIGAAIGYEGMRKATGYSNETLSAMICNLEKAEVIVCSRGGLQNGSQWMTNAYTLSTDPTLIKKIQAEWTHFVKEQALQKEHRKQPTISARPANWRRVTIKELNQ